MNWRKAFYGLSVGLVLASFVVYGVRAARMEPVRQAWAGYSAQEKDQAIAAYGLDRPLAVQHGGFLALFLPGILLGIACALFWWREAPFPHSPLTKTVLVLALFTSLITILNYIMLAPSPIVDLYPWWFVLSLAGLGLLGILSTLALWHGRKAGLYVLAVVMSLISVLTFLGGTPLLNAVFTFTLVIAAWFFTRPVWHQMG